MHTKVISVNRSTVENLQKKSGNIIAVGTTSVRTLESLYHIGLKLHNNPANTDFSVWQWTPYETQSELPAF